MPDITHRQARIDNFLSLTYPTATHVATNGYLIATLPADSSSAPQGIFLICDADTLEPRDLTEEAYEAIVDEQINAGLSNHRYHVLSRFNLFVTDDVQWTQITSRNLDV